MFALQWLRLLVGTLADVLVSVHVFRVDSQQGYNIRDRGPHMRYRQERTPDGVEGMCAVRSYYPAIVVMVRGRKITVQGS